mmetsp:Transcript_6754/g.14143  ORF Transcript_6754/g.14143 Transcript_6754/m.14143 type:complete len:1094 (+) Transcript_6754:76-3357(+)
MKTAKRKVADMEISTDDESDEPCDISISSDGGGGGDSSSGNSDRSSDAKWSTQPQCQDSARRQRGGGGGEKGEEQPSREIGSVRELNRLLESALRIGGDDNYTPGDTVISSGGHGVGGSAGVASQADATASWRLDTARRLSSLLSSQNPYLNQVTSTNRNANDNNNDTSILLPALKRQSRYWIPLLLSWLRQDSGSDSSDFDNSVESLQQQFTGKSRRNRHGGSSGNGNNFGNNSTQNQNQLLKPDVQIEALRALTALTEWTARVDNGGRGCNNKSKNNGSSKDNGGNNNNNSKNNSNMSSSVTAGCTPQNPLNPSSQRLLLRHADAVPMIVSLLSSPDPVVHEQAVWILGSIGSSGLSGAVVATSTTPNPVSSGMDVDGPSTAVAAANAAAAELTKVFNSEGPGCGVDGSVSVTVPTFPPSSGTNFEGDGVKKSVPKSFALDTDIHSDDRGKDSRGSSNKDKSSSVSARDVILAAGALNPILRCLEANPESVTLHRNGAWCLSSLVEGRYSGSNSSSSNNDGPGGSGSSSKKYSPLNEINIINLLPTLKRMLHMEDAEVLTYTCWTLSHLCDGPSAHIAAVIYSEAAIASFKSSKTKALGIHAMSPEAGLVPRLVELLVHPCPKVAKPALRTIGNIVCAECSDQQSQDSPFPIVDYTEIILECEAVPQLRQLVEHQNREIQKEACWTLSNIAAGTTSQIQSVIDSGAIPPLVELVNNSKTDKEVRSEACWVVLNATSCGSDEQIETLVEEGCVSVLGVLLNEPNMAMMALEGLERVLQTEEAKDAAYMRSLNGDIEYEPQRQVTLKCATLIKGVTLSTNCRNDTIKRARRIWESHFVSCALCHGSFSRYRIHDARFCNECKCHVCSQCDCRVYHLSYQEELWAEDEDKAEAKKNAKKSKKQKKKEKEKQKKEKKKQENQFQQPKKARPSTNAPHLNESAAVNPDSKQSEAATNSSSCSSGDPTSSKNTTSQSSTSSNVPPNVPTLEQKSRRNDTGPAYVPKGSRKTTSLSPSRGTFDDDTASLGMDGDPMIDESDHNQGQPPIDLVLYLQQTGSIIALAKLMDSLYDDDYDDEDVNRDQPRINTKNPAFATQ